MAAAEPCRPAGAACVRRLQGVVQPVGVVVEVAVRVGECVVELRARLAVQVVVGAGDLQQALQVGQVARQAVGSAPALQARRHVTPPAVVEVGDGQPGARPATQPLQGVADRRHKHVRHRPALRHPHGGVPAPPPTLDTGAGRADDDDARAPRQLAVEPRHGAAATRHVRLLPDVQRHLACQRVTQVTRKLYDDSLVSRAVVRVEDEYAGLSRRRVRGQGQV